MNNALQSIRWGVGTLGLVSALGLGIFGIVNESMSDGERKSHRIASFPANSDYVEECGACHLAYPPTLLPARSWQALMTGLDDHFNDNAELPAEIVVELLAYLVDNAADSDSSRSVSRLLGGTGRATPLRITELPYFLDEHDEIPTRMAEENPDVRSFSNCGACHVDAQRGLFDDDSVVIPNFGRWDD